MCNNIIILQHIDPTVVTMCCFYSQGEEEEEEEEEGAIRFPGRKHSLRSPMDGGGDEEGVIGPSSIQGTSDHSHTWAFGSQVSFVSSDAREQCCCLSPCFGPNLTEGDWVRRRARDRMTETQSTLKFAC